ncbi:MAG: tRNA/rRNA methyltransferase [Cyclobacteriaceae bacterium]
MRIHFILSHPAVPENIGFVCRAMKTMGFSNLLLVNSENHLDQKALKTAYGSHDILDSAKIYSELSEAIKGMDLVIGTAAKNRVGRHDYYEPKKLVYVLNSKTAAVNNVAMVFGSERNGLSNQEIELCDLLTTIPLQTGHPSLNLAQAVMVYAYELSQMNVDESSPGESIEPETDQRRLKTEVIKLLDYLQIDNQPSLYRRLKDRLMSASADDTSLILSLSRFLKRKLDD